MFRPFFLVTGTSGNANLRYAVAFANPFAQHVELQIHFLELKFIGHYDSPLEPKKTTRVFAFMPRFTPLGTTTVTPGCTCIARMYYESDMRQSEIAEQLDLSQATVSRLLRRSKEEGIIRTSINLTKGCGKRCFHARTCRPH